MSAESANKALELVSRLIEARKTCADSPEATRRERLDKVLDEALTGLPAGKVNSLVEEAREHVVGQARLREERLEALAGQLEQSKAELEKARASSAELEQLRARVQELEGGAQEAADLRSKLGALEAERDELNAKLATAPAPPAAPGPPPIPVAAGGEQAAYLETFREALRATAEERGGAQDAGAGLPDSEQRFLGLMQELLRFALELDRGVQAFLMELEIGPAMDTVQIRGYQRQVMQRFCDCLDNKEGSIQALTEILERNRRFLILLNEAYRASIPVGTSGVLDELAPEPILAESKGKGLLKIANHEGAFKELTRRHGDLAGLPPSEMLTRYFTEPFQSSLRELLARSSGGR